MQNDSEIKTLIDNGTLTSAESGRVGQVTYDLRTDAFVDNEGTKHGSVSLMPGDSAFIQCVEGIKLPNDLAAKVLLRNSRIRQGLTLDAPLYFPGHSTVLYYRVTNVSADRIDLNSEDGIAQVCFERVEQPVEKAYEGTFQKEMSFSGMGKYAGAYKSQMQEVEKKADEVKGIEHRMYGNVIAIMAIIAGIFTLVNVNVQGMGDGLKNILVLNLSTVGSFSVLVALIAPLMKLQGKRFVAPLCIAVACFLVAILCAAFM